MTDPRQLRTANTLRHAILTLAATRPIEEITVSDIARAASVTRATVYNHAASPETLLTNALLPELERIHAGFLEGARNLPGDVGAVWRTSERALLTHVNDHRAIYAHGLRPSGLAHGSALAEMLASFIARGLREWHSVRLNDEADISPLHSEMASAFISRGTVGAITAWLLDEAEPEIDVALDLILEMIPTWWLQSTPPRTGSIGIVDATSLA